MNDIPAKRQLQVSENPQRHSPRSTQVTSPSSIPPATAKEGIAELLACLTLVAPSGMTAEDRTAWAIIARGTLSGIPADLLRRGCKRARETCRFASEIVPAILAEVQGEWNRRKRVRAELEAREASRNTPLLAEPQMVDATEIRGLIRSLFKMEPRNG